MTDVLLAEDDEAIATPLARALTREGYGCEIVSTGPDALERARDTASSWSYSISASRRWTVSRCVVASAACDHSSPC